MLLTNGNFLYNHSQLKIITCRIWQFFVLTFKKLDYNAKKYLTEFIPLASTG